MYNGAAELLPPPHRTHSVTWISSPRPRRRSPTQIRGVPFDGRTAPGAKRPSAVNGRPLEGRPQIAIPTDPELRPSFGLMIAAACRSRVWDGLTDRLGRSGWDLQCTTAWSLRWSRSRCKNGADTDRRPQQRADRGRCSVHWPIQSTTDADHFTFTAKKDDEVFDRRLSRANRFRRRILTHARSRRRTANP